MEFFAPFSPSTPIRHEGSEFRSSRTLLEAAQQREYGDSLGSVRSTARTTIDSPVHEIDRLEDNMIVDGSYGPPPGHSQAFTPDDYESLLHSRAQPDQMLGIPPLGNQQQKQRHPEIRAITSYPQGAAFDATSIFSSVLDATPATTIIQSNSLEKRSFSPIESPSFLPEYVIDNFLVENPDAKGYFCVFRKSHILKADGVTKYDGAIPPAQAQLWNLDSVFGHLFEVTWWGSLVYHGPFEEDEKEFTSYWSKLSAMKELKDPASETNLFLQLPTELYDYSSALYLEDFEEDDIIQLAELYDASQKPPSKMATIEKSDHKISFKKVESTDINSYMEKTGYFGSWKRLFNVPGYRTLGQTTCEGTHSAKVKYLHYINFTKLVGYMLALGKCQPKHIAAYIVSEPTLAFVKVNTRVAEKYHPNEFHYPSIRLKMPVSKKWEDQGWHVTELEGMNVLVC